MDDDDLPEAIPAATLILMRPAEGGGPPEILMLERSETMAFAAGALVFPGGRIDPEDEAMAGRFPDLPDAAARIAAIRETIEETGVAPALRPAPDSAALRSAMAGGRPFPELLDEMGLELDPGALTPFARWCPNFREARRFDTLFYLAEAPSGGRTLHSADETESVHTFWASAAEVLAEIDSGRAKAIFPTRRNLERLARFGSLDEARADAALHPVRRITPWVEERGGKRFVCIPEGIGYPVTSEPYESARRR
ncbi:MAG TPA: NUDIX domain-containing protein [Allosphingosinicella sp.]|jgi:8-oxo-dGTP pyrophosphatase MutT (NUDIX family)|nr:NUDIX domain-containing protein [Allosphingosinicella sp.]